MEIDLAPGKYILAVSGGVDSMVLLELMAKKASTEVVVAHFNHGIRPDAGKDEALVRQRAKQLDLPFEAGYGKLGKAASEELARKARYKFLFEAQKKYKADAIVTAHHQDDLIETALLNLMRGTNRKGLVAISSNKQVLRPLLKYSKEEIRRYAVDNGVAWREDKTNTGNVYLRNSLRKELSTGLTDEKRQKILDNVEKVAKMDIAINKLIANLSHQVSNGDNVNRNAFSSLPVEVGDELVAYWLRARKVADFDRRTVSRINLALRTFKDGSICPIKDDLRIELGKKTARFRVSLVNR